MAVFITDAIISPLSPLVVAPQNAFQASPVDYQRLSVATSQRRKVLYAEVGVRCYSEWLSPEMYSDEIEVGCEVSLGYNRFGRVAGVTVL